MRNYKYATKLGSNEFSNFRLLCKVFSCEAFGVADIRLHVLIVQDKMANMIFKWIPLIVIIRHDLFVESKLHKS